MGHSALKILCFSYNIFLYNRIKVVYFYDRFKNLGIGLSTQNVNPSKLPGWEKELYGYHANDGHCFVHLHCYGPTFTTGDTVSRGLN